MAILSQFDSNKWLITLNREETDSEPELVPNDFSFTSNNNTVTSITGSGITRTIVLTEEVATLDVSQITIINHDTTPIMEVISAQNALVIPFLAQIRNLLGVELSKEDLPDATILQAAFLRTAELQMYSNLGINGDTAYDAKVTSNSGGALFQERTRIATIYRTAALLVPVLPSIIESSIESERIRYTEIDWEEKINFFLNAADAAVKEDIPSDLSDGDAIVGLISQCVAF